MRMLSHWGAATLAPLPYLLREAVGLRTTFAIFISFSLASEATHGNICRTESNKCIVMHAMLIVWGRGS